jgi:hypothetical protein
MIVYTQANFSYNIPIQIIPIASVICFVDGTYLVLAWESGPKRPLLLLCFPRIPLMQEGLKISKTTLILGGYKSFTPSSEPPFYLPLSKLKKYKLKI